MSRIVGLLAFVVFSFATSHPISAAETLVIEEPAEPNRDPDQGGDATNNHVFAWVQPVKMTCSSDAADEPAPPIIARVEPLSAGFANASFDGPSGCRDCRGRGATAIGFDGVLDNHLVIEHFAGQEITIEVSCGGTTRELRGRVTDQPPAGWSGGAHLPSAVADDDEGGCATVRADPGSLALLLAVVFMARRRRRWMLVLLVAASSCGACDGGDEPDTLQSAERVFAGVGEPNQLPLWPLGVGVRHEHGPHSTDGSAEPNDSQPTGHSMKLVAGGTLHAFHESVALPSISRGGMELIVDEVGDIYLARTYAGPIDPPILFVPREVRLAKSWTVRHDLDLEQLRNPIHGLRSDDNDEWRFTVSHRNVVPTPDGERVAWRIEWVGPVAPHADDTTSAIPPPEQVYRIRGWLDFVEGVGPVGGELNLHALDMMLGLNTFSNTTHEPVVEPFDPAALVEGATPLPEVDALGIAGSTPQEAPLLELTRIDGEFASNAIVHRLRGLGTTDGDLEIFVQGEALGNTLLQTEVYEELLNTTAEIAGCSTVGDGIGTPDDCRPQWYGFVHPDGTVWEHTETRYRDAVLRHSNVFYDGWFPYVAWLDDGELRAFAESGLFRGQFGIVTFGEQQPDYLGGGPVTVAERMHASPLPVVYPRLSEEAIFAARAHDDRVALLGLPRTRFDDAFAAVISNDGTTLRRQRFPAAGMSIFSGEDGHFVAQVGRLGELRSIVFDAAGVWPELRGRLNLPEGHWAVAALQLDEDSFIVALQSGPEWDFSAVSVDHHFDNRLGLALREPPVAGPTTLWRVEAPPTGVVDEALAIEMLDVELRGEYVTLCTPPNVDLTFGRAQIGMRDVEAVHESASCQAYALTTEERAYLDTEDNPRLWLSVVIEGHGWVRRDVRIPEVEVAAPAGGPAPTLDGSTVGRSQWCEPFTVRCHPTSATLDGVSIDGDAAIDEAATEVVSRAGAGLWLLGEGADCDVNLCEWNRPAGVGADDVPYILATPSGRTTFWAPAGMRYPAEDGGLVGGGHHLSVDGTVTQVAPGPEQALDEVRWVFADGTACGTDAGAFVCVDADSISRALNGPHGADAVLWGVGAEIVSNPQFLESRAAFTDPETGMLVPAIDGGVFVDILDVGAMVVDRRQVASGEPGDSEPVVGGPLYATDGSLWWTVTPSDADSAGALLVKVHDGVATSFPYLGDGSAFAVSPTHVLHASGLHQPRPDVDGGGECVPTAERCNVVDDDCDGQVDEGDTPLCTGPNGVASCIAGTCVVSSCDDGWDDCDGDGDNGCETALGTVTDCLACDDACGNGEMCLADGCGAAAITSIAAGSRHFCAVDSDDRVTCAGRTEAIGNAGASDSDGPGFVTGFTSPPVSVVAADHHACAILTDATVACWGRGGLELGPSVSAANTIVEDPVVIAGIDQVTALSTSQTGTCVVRAAGELWCWGDALLDLVGAASNMPTRIGTATDFVEVAVGYDSGCARQIGGAVSCWGGIYAPMGPGTAPRDLQLVDVLPATTRIIASGANTPRYVFETGSGAYALGVWGQMAPVLGAANAAQRWWVPERVSGLDDATALAVSDQHLCKVDGAGAIACAGEGSRYELGAFGNHYNTFAVTPSTSGLSYVDVAVTQDASCAVVSDGTLECAGDATHLGEMGRFESFLPVAIP